MLIFWSLLDILSLLGSLYNNLSIVLSLFEFRMSLFVSFDVISLLVYNSLFNNSLFSLLVSTFVLVSNSSFLFSLSSTFFYLILNILSSFNNLSRNFLILTIPVLNVN